MKVRIYQPAKSAMQSGRAKTNQWVLEYIPTSPRVPEPLMGWTSSKDTLNQVKLKFESAEEAAAYAQRRGWAYSIVRPKTRKLRPRNYGDNFKIMDEV